MIGHLHEACLDKDAVLTNRCAAFAFALVAVLAAAAPAFAADPPLAAVLSPEDQALVQKATDYLQTLKGVQGKFTQTDPKGLVSAGAFYMQRPGKIRFQYDPPAQLLVVSDGSTVSIYDRKLKSFDQYPLAQTPLALLLAKEVRLDRAIAVAKVERSKTGFAITARDARHPALGGLVLAFSSSPLTLQGWTVLDAQGQKTTVTLAGLTEASRFPAELFVLHDPRPRAARP